MKLHNVWGYGQLFGFSGLDGKNYYFNDPWHNHGVIGYDRALVEKRHGEQYEMAVGVEICHKI